MKSIETCLPRPVVVYYFAAPNQRLVRWTYASLKKAKKIWNPCLLVHAAQAALRPWVSHKEWQWHKEGARPIYSVKPTQGLVLRYVGSAEVPSGDIVAPTPRKRRRKHKNHQPSQRTAGRRLRQQQRLDDGDPGERPSQRVQPLYYEDAWCVRRSERSWKSHRKTQWQA